MLLNEGSERKAACYHCGGLSFIIIAFNARSSMVAQVEFLHPKMWAYFTATHSSYCGIQAVGFD